MKQFAIPSSSTPGTRMARWSVSSGVVWFALVAMLVLLTPRIWAQDNATINGTVADASGALVPNAADHPH